MPISNRNVTIKSIFAASANTTIPSPPVVGTSYRNETVTTQEIAAGWPYKEIVDSGKFNEAMYEYTTICKLLEEYGFLPWSPYTDYPAQGCAMGTDGNVYQAKVATGPNTTAVDPVTDTSHNTWDLFYYSDFTADRAIISNAGGKLTASGVTSSELGYLSGVTSAIQAQINAKAADNAVVHLAGAETITGNKTFSGNVKLTETTDAPQKGLFISNNNTNYAISVQNTEVTKGTAPSEGVIFGVDFYGTKADNNKDRFGAIECIYDTNKSTSLAMVLYDATSAENTSNAKVQLFHNGTTGATFTLAPASDVGGSIVTTVNKSKASNGYIQFGNGLIVQWGRVTASRIALTITLPKAFSSATSYSISAIANTGKAAFSTTQTATTFTLDASGGIDTTSLKWIAIGY